MASIQYALGAQAELDQLFPPAKFVNHDVGIKNLPDVIAHYTRNSLIADGLAPSTVRVELVDKQYFVSIDCRTADDRLRHFAKAHQQLFSRDAAGKAIAGKELLQKLGVWNPMEGFPVNEHSNDGHCKWHLFPPLGLNIIGQRGVLLLHYPPWQVLQQATFLEVMTMHRWNTVLKASGVPEDAVSFYRTIVDVNPIAAPGMGQSEYPNDYFPIMMASAFFDGPPERDYIRTMLEFYLNGLEAAGTRFTLPLLICGSPLYDPQAAGWFRASYKHDLPVNAAGTPTVDVLQAGSFRIRHESARATPYLIANHMIAAGVTGKCTKTPGEIPDIRKYEAQDLVAASFLQEYASDPDLDPAEAKRRACRRWFGNDDGSAEPNPPDNHDRRMICALAQMDLFFEPGPPPHPVYSFEEAMERCASADDEPCGSKVGPHLC
jgi:hypothetical protein